MIDNTPGLTPTRLALTGQAMIASLTLAPSVDDPADAEALAREHARADALVALFAAANLTQQPPNNPDNSAQAATGESTHRDTAAADVGTACGAGTGPGIVLTVTSTLDGLIAAIAGAGALETGGLLSAAELRMLACDCHVVPAVMSGACQVLDLGRATRVWSSAQRRAAVLRDQGCTAPGCDRPPAACHLHHATHWADGGPTDLNNAALLCSYHHHLVHRQGWTVGLGTNGYPEFTPPTSIDPEQRPRQHHRFTLRHLTTRPRT